MKTIDLKEQKEILVNILKYIDGVCRKNKIQYTLVAGSLIGAIRHKGFIPWDDDIDIGLLPHNYDKLMKCLKADGNPQYRLLTVDTEKTYYYPFAKVVATYTSGYENGCKKIKDYGVYVDIFKYNYLPDDLKKTKDYYNKLMSIKRKLGKSIYNTTRHLILKPLVWIRSRKNSRKLAKDFIVFSEQFNNKKGTRVMGNWPDHNITECVLPANIFDKYVDAKFENIDVMIVKEYDFMLRKVFGDYMKLPPKEEQISHHNMTIYRDDSYEK
jgi:lipopolysaccharide cholinephosphotransferase